MNKRVCTQDDKALDKAWKKESMEAGEGMGHTLYQLFKKRQRYTFLTCCPYRTHSLSVTCIARLGSGTRTVLVEISSSQAKHRTDALSRQLKHW